MKVNIVLLITFLNLITLGCRAKYKSVRGVETELNIDKSRKFSATFIGRIPKNAKPTAQLDVLVDNALSQFVIVNQIFEVKPTIDSFDSDNAGDLVCVRNPGIVSAEYTVKKENKVQATYKVSRDINKCENLAKKIKIDTTGSYNISMELTSDEGEKATSSLSIVVLKEKQLNINKFGDQEDFKISLNDRLLSVEGKYLNFQGRCQGGTQGSINWQFGDTKAKDGAEVLHSYKTVGQFNVVSRCFTDNGVALNSSITIYISK